MNIMKEMTISQSVERACHNKNKGELIQLVMEVTNFWEIAEARIKELEKQVECKETKKHGNGEFKGLPFEKLVIKNGRVNFERVVGEGQYLCDYCIDDSIPVIRVEDKIMYLPSYPRFEEIKSIVFGLKKIKSKTGNPVMDAVHEYCGA